MVSARTAQVLARCNGFRVKVRDEVVGTVATPVFSGRSVLPEYLVVRVEADSSADVFRAVTPEQIQSADAASETVVLDIDRSELAELPEPEVLRRAFASTPPPPPTSAGAAPTQDQDQTLRRFRVLVRHRMATPLTVIRGCVATLRDFPGSSRGEVLQLVAAIEAATRELERAALDFDVLDLERDAENR